MPQGDKSAYTGKQKRQAEHIEQTYLKRGLPEAQAEQIAWSTVNKQDGGNLSGSGRSEAARRGWETRRKRDATSGR